MALRARKLSGVLEKRTPLRLIYLDKFRSQHSLQKDFEL